MVHLTVEQKAAIRASWAAYISQPNANVIFYQTLLGEHPQYQPFFPALKGAKPEEFASCPYIRDGQGPKIALAFGELVAKLDDVAALHNAVHKIVSSEAHTKVHLRREDYIVAFSTLRHAIKKVIGDKYKYAEDEAWHKFGDLVGTFIGAELSAEQKSAVKNTFAEFNRDIKNNMGVFYQVLFCNNPHYQAQFPQLEGVPPCQAGSNTFIRDIQAPKVGRVFAEMVLKLELDDLNGLRAVVQRMRNQPQHAKLTKTDFCNSFKALISAICKTNKDIRLKEIAAWAKFGDLVISML